MVPLDPGDLFALRVPDWLHVEIGSTDQLDRPDLSICIGQCQAILTLIRVNKQHLAAIRRNGWRGAVTKLRRDGLGQPGIDIHLVKTVIAGKDCEAIPDCEITAAVAYTGANFHTTRNITGSVSALFVH